MARVRQAALAEHYLEEIWFHIALDNPAAADRVLDTVAENCRLLAQNNLMGRKRPDLSNELRSFPSGRYMLYYRPLKDGIELVRVLDAARDIDTLFQEDDPL